MRTLLPEDAVLAGTWQFGTLQSAPQDADEWVSADLAARYRLLGEPLTGSVLVLYTYDGDAYNPGSITRVELRPAVIPELESKRPATSSGKTGVRSDGYRTCNVC